MNFPSMQNGDDAADTTQVLKVLDVCQDRVNVADIVATAATNTICLDGTSCTKKTSILMATGYRVTKVQQSHPTHNPDTYFPSLIGYISAGLEDLCNVQPHYNDRSPLNVLDWYILWHAMDKFMRQFGNVRIDVDTNPGHAEFVDEFIGVFTKYRTVYYRELLNKTVTCIAIIDTNVDRVDELRCRRNQGSDASRSKWRFYTQLQNIMYQTLYPDRYIDLAWFDDDSLYSTATVVCGVASFLNTILNLLIQKPSTQLVSFFPQCKLPTLRTDYSLNNADTHIQRAAGRWTCKMLAMDALPGAQPPQPFNTFVPKHLYVDNVYNPLNNEKLDPIVPETVHPLINTGPLNNNDVDNLEYIDDCSLDCYPEAM